MTGYEKHLGAAALEIVPVVRFGNAAHEVRMSVNMPVFIGDLETSAIPARRRPAAH
jgi:hypothetical protein